MAFCKRKIHRISSARNASYTTLWSQPQAGLGSMAPECGKPGSGLQGVCCNTTWNEGWDVKRWQIDRVDMVVVAESIHDSISVKSNLMFLEAQEQELAFCLLLNCAGKGLCDHDVEREGRVHPG